MRRAASLIAFLLASAAAHAAWYPVFRPTYVRVRPGETVTVSAYAAWLSGWSYYPFSPMTFAAMDPAIASVDGSLPTTAETTIRITGLTPGVTRVRVLETYLNPWPTAALIVVGNEELPVNIDVRGTLAPGEAIVLRAFSDEPDATYAWYEGRIGALTFYDAGRGQELTVVPEFPFTYQYFVVMTSARGAGATGVVLEVHNPPVRRRGVRH